MNILEKFKPITTFIFDVDGVLTDGTVLVLAGGLQARRMHIKDGFALQMAQMKGYNVKVISGGNSPEVMDRLDKLGVKDVDMSVLDKKKIIEEYIMAKKLKKEEVLYMGDDIPDFHVMQLVGLPTCPQDASPEIKAISTYISHKNGGKGAVRDVIEQVMKVQGKWHTYYNGKHD